MSQALYNHAFNIYRTGDLPQAELLLQKIVNTQPSCADAWHLLGIIYYQTTRSAMAVIAIEKAVAIAPRHLDYLNNLGLALHANQQYAMALKAFQQAILLNPKDLDVQLNIANLYFNQQEFEEAASYYRRLQRMQAKRADIRDALVQALTELGNAAHLNCNYLKAESAFTEAIKLHPQNATLYYNLGNAERALGKLTESKKHYALAILHNPNDADFYNNLGNVQRECGQLAAAIASYEKALSINSKLYHAQVHWVHQKQQACDWLGLDAKIQEIRTWVQYVPAAQVSPFAFLAMPTTSAQEQKMCASNWIKNRYCNLIAQRDALHFTQQKTPKSKLKIAYLSADFRLHPLAFLISELIELHDRSAFEIVAYSFGVNDQSSARNRLVKAFDAFYDIRALSEIDAAKKIYADEVDILVDLTGFTQTSRSGIVALKPAKIHVNWLGFAGTMGDVSTSEALFDYILTDRFISPPEQANHYAEKCAYLPCYQPNDSQRPIGKTPSRSECGLPENQFVFCCFNQSFKITEEIFSCWLRILTAAPHSVLWLLECNALAKQHLLAFAAQYGIQKERLIFAPRIAIADHLARHAHANLFLDTLPYNAHTSCSDALWMKVPVLTLVGDTFSARVAGSLLHALNLNELITYHLQDYENKALFFYEHRDALVKIKQKISLEKSNSSLFNAQNFVKNLEESYQTMWNISLHHQ